MGRLMAVGKALPPRSECGVIESGGSLPSNDLLRGYNPVRKWHRGLPFAFSQDNNGDISVRGLCLFC
jgi:hypothetical protein